MIVWKTHFPDDRSFRKRRCELSDQAQNQRLNSAFFKNQRMTFIAIFVTTERGKFWVEKSEINEWKQRLAYYAGDT